MSPEIADEVTGHNENDRRRRPFYPGTLNSDKSTYADSIDKDQTAQNVRSYLWSILSSSLPDIVTRTALNLEIHESIFREMTESVLFIYKIAQEGFKNFSLVNILPYHCCLNGMLWGACHNCLYTGIQRRFRHNLCAFSVPKTPSHTFRTNALQCLYLTLSRTSPTFYVSVVQVF